MSSETPAPPRSARAIVAFLLLAPVLGWLVWRSWWLCDDAFISFRYAEHLAGGIGLRYNPTDPPIEGYSNFLWVVWLAGLRLLGAAIPTAATWSSAACAFVLLWLLLRHLARERPAPLWRLVLAPLVLVTLPPFHTWATSGLATMPAACALFAVWELLLGERGRCRWRAAAAVGALGVLLRADAVLFLGAVHAGALVAGRLAKDEELLRGVRRSGFTVVWAFGVQSLFRFLYHGDWIPNTARVKTGMSAMSLERGLKYDAEFLLSYAAVPAVLLLALVLPGRGGRAQRWTAGSMVAATFAYGVYIGGDFMAMGRMLVVALPFAAVLLAGSLERLAQLRPKALGAGLAATFGAACVACSLAAGQGRYVTPESWRERVHFRWNYPEYVTDHTHWLGMVQRAQDWADLGRALKANTKPGESLVIGTIGAVGYYSGLHIHDTFGLTNRAGEAAEVRRKRRSPGHDRHVPMAYFLAQDPTYVGAELVPPDQPGYMLYPHLRPTYEYADRIDIRFLPVEGDDRLLRLAFWLGL